ncbi:sugar-binding protein [Planctomycetota bacterium]
MCKKLIFLISVLVLFSVSTSQALVIGDFEDGLDGWAPSGDNTVTLSTIGASTGTGSALLEGPGSWQMLALLDIKALRSVIAVEGAAISADVTAFAEDMETGWMNMEMIINGQNHDETGANNNIGWQSLGGLDIVRDGVTQTLVWDVPADLSAKIAGVDDNIEWFELFIVTNNGAANTKIYIDNIQMLGAEPEQVDMEIGFATSPPVLDGQVDEIWAGASTQYFVPLDDPADGSGSWKALYDSENLYVIVDVTDDSLQNDSDGSWQDDSVELYFDGGNTKLNTPLAGDDHQYNFAWTTDEIQGTNIDGATEGIEHAQVDTDTGWRIEIKLPWLSIQGAAPQAGDLIGIDCYYNDDDDGGDSREGKMLGFSVVEGWNDASQWGTAILKEIPPIAKDPNPADGAIRVSPEPLLHTPISEDVPMTIPDRWMTTTTVTSSLTVSDSFTITDLNVELNISHPKNNADLNVYLIGPDGTQVELFTDVGVWDKNFKNTVLDDEAGTSIKNGSGSFTGIYKPEGKLSAFDGKNAQGTWKLKISDDWNSGVGTLNSWGLTIESPNILSWVPADNISSQDVYISKNFDEVNDSADAAYQGNFAADVSTIEIIFEVGQEYFWRVDSVNADGMLIRAGDIWSFWTTPEPILVDPDSDLGAANELVKPGGTIEFAAGTYNITSQIIVKEGVIYMGAGPELTIIDGNDATRAFAAWGDRGANNGQVDENGNGITNLTGPTRWAIEGMTIQNCASDEDNRQDILSAARDLLNNYTGTPYTLATAQEENGAIGDNPEWFEILSGAADDDLTDAELQAYLDAVPVGSEGHYVVNGDKRDDGGAICILNGADGTIRNCDFSNNSAVDDGGAIMVDGEALVVVIENCTFNLNTCGDQAGAVKLSGNASNSTVTDCSFTDNSAPEDDAGAIQMDGAGSTGSVYTLTDCTFTGCSALDDGGAIFANADNSTYVWTDCDFVGNYVTDSGADGGAVRYAPDRANITVTNCSFIGNGMDPDGTPVGDDGGAWKTDNDNCGPVTFMNCLFVDNASKDDRVIEVKAVFSILNCTFIGNVAGDEALIGVRGQDWNSTGDTDDEGNDIDDVTTDDSIIANCLFINNTLLSNKEVIGDTRNDVFAPAVINCLFFGNLDQNEEPAINTDDNSVEVGTIDVSAVTDAAQIVVDPAGDYNIAEGSPAIDASDPDTATAADIVGMPAFGIRDVGAYESEYEPPVLPSDVTAPGDIVQGVPNDGLMDGDDWGWPGAETPDLAIDDDINTKFLHFKGENEPTGIRVTPSGGPSIVTEISLTTANDSPERDPITFELSGSNDSIDGPYEVIASGDVVDFAGEVEWPRFTKNATAITFDNDVAYAHYQLLFPTVRDAGSANSMQIAEVELLGVAAE